MKNHTDTILPHINKIVSPQFCKRTAFLTGFIKRSTNRLNGYEFVKAMILGTEGDTLLKCKKRIVRFHAIGELSVPGLAQKINQPSAENLMLQILLKCLTNLYEKTNSKLKNISRILIQDSTCLPLNKTLANIYSGSGGHHTNSGIKIDCIYDYTNEAILDIKHHARIVSDAQNGNVILKHLEANDLVLRDLGYFKIEELKAIDEKQAFFITRLKGEVLVYLRFEDKNPLTFIEFLKKKLRKKDFFDCIAYIGKSKQKVRLVINKVPEWVINQRLRKANRAAQVGRTSLSDSKKAFLSYTILVTNMPFELVSPEDILMLYGIRWRIELVFKEWKSQIRIGNITGTNIHRIRCLIYARLCLLLIINKYTSYVIKMSLNLYGIELSIKKVLDVLIEENLMHLFLKKRMDRVLKEMLGKKHRELLKSKQRKRQTTLEKLQNSKLVA